MFEVMFFLSYLYYFFKGGDQQFIIPKPKECYFAEIRMVPYHNGMFLQVKIDFKFVLNFVF